MLLNHEVTTRRWPYMTVCLIGLNVLGFAFAETLGSRAIAFVQQWGVVPARLQSEISAHDALTIGSSMFLHVGVVHLLGIMWFLWVFGDAVEDAFGRWLFLALYLVSGVCAQIVFVAIAHGSSAPAVGADGAVAGVIAASIVLWPRARLKTPGIVLLLWVIALQYELLLAIGLPSGLMGGIVAFIVLTLGSMLLTRNAGGFIAGLLRPVALPAWAGIALFMSVQLFAGLLTVVNPAFAGVVGYGACLGGFAAGAVLAWLLPKHPKLLADRPLLG